MTERLETLGLVDAIGRERFYPSVRAAVEGCLREQELERPAPSDDAGRTLVAE